ncbi:neutral alpha-glucosidase C-like [Chironomus tepperi]|uniref:neutral alpha-glucosidase C-like n=1 Tax=Chironomus tepperi TaxID=113505 RepID=UPI00391EFAEA
MKFKLFLLLCAVNFSFVINVPENLTKKCEQSSFCRRCRNIEANKSPFDIVFSTVSYTENEVKMDIINKNTQNVLHMKLECLDGNTFHFDIDEKAPIKNGRFRLNNEVIDHQSTVKSIQVVPNQASNLVNVTCDKNSAVLQISPFKIDFYRDGVLTVTTNGKGLMTYEHLQFKVTPAAGDDPDSWEETYMGMTDTKPNGPEAVALDFTFADSQILFGIPEHHDTFALRRTSYGEPYHLFTNDATFYEVDSRMPNYGAVPVIYGHAIGRTSGIFWHNSADTYVDIHDTQTAHFITEGGIIDVYVFLGPTPNDAFSQYTKITGVGNLPQLFTLGYHQCRWSYMNSTQVLDIVSEFDKNLIPLDTMWLDIDYTDGYRYFTWNNKTFPKPLEFMAKLKETGRRLVHIIDPHIKADENYFFFKETRDQNMLVKTNTKNDYYGSCWPGNSTYLDYLNPVARKYYADQYLLDNFSDNSVETGIWNDMNEPAVFDSPEKTFPRDNIHTNGEIEVEHRLVHNIYGFLHTKATFDGLSRRSADYRPFILTRSFFAGSQKYTSVWTGDNTADWPYLKASIQACLAISVSGISFCGSDIGGFFGDPDDDLFVRWTQAAAFQPFFRNHASWNTKMREPYVWKNKTKTLAINAMRRRYEFLPFWYTLFYEHEMTGYPIMRPMLAQYPNDKNIFNLDTQYMLSDKLLVSPVLEPKSTFVIVRFPSTNGADEGDIWYDIYDNYKKYDKVGTQGIEASEDKVPVFQRGGTIIPRKMEPRQSSFYMRDDPLTLFVAVDKDLKATGNVFIDDETSYKYRDGSYKMVDFKFDNMTLTVTENAFKQYRPKYDRIYIARSGKITKGTFNCANVTQNMDAVPVADEYFYIEVKSLSCDELSWTLTLVNSGMMTIMSRGLLMSIIIFNVIKKLLF